jgi:protein-disulfide isomerase
MGKKARNASNARQLAQKRQEKQLQQQKQMRRIVWITSLCIVALIVLALVFKPKASPAEFAYDTLPMLGSPDAPVKIVEFGDFKCPSCRDFSQKIKPQLEKDYIDTGKASFYYMHDLIISPDADSYTAALAATAVYHQDKHSFWPFYDTVFQNQGDERTTWATPEFLTDLARKKGLPVDMDKLKRDIVSKTYADEVDKQDAQSRRMRVDSTPTLYINGKEIPNPFDYNALKKEIEQAIQEASKS